MKNIRKVAIILLLVLVAIFVTGCQESDEAKYKNAQSLMAKGDYIEAAIKFDELGSYEEASKLSMYCKAAAAGESGDYETAFSTFKLLGDYKESQFMITYYQARKYESAFDSGVVNDGSDLISASKKYDSLTVFRDSKERAEACRKKAYDCAVEWAGKGYYSDAINVLNALGQYDDSVKLSQYYEALRLEQEKDFNSASIKFADIGSYKDAEEQAVQVMQRGYDYAASLETDGDQLGAYNAFMSLGSYKDSFERACKPYYALGETYRTNNEWNKAVAAFTQAGTYSDAPTQILVTYYEEGKVKRTAQDWDGAVNAFLHAGDYSDASTQIKETRYQQASALESSGDQEAAFNLFMSLTDYKDSYDRAYKTYYDLGVEKRNAREWNKAVEAFRQAGTYSDATTQVLATYYEEGEVKRNAHDWDGAVVAFTFAEDYLDAKEQINETYYQQAIARCNNMDWVGAIDIFEKIETYKDAFEQIKEVKYQGAKDFYEKGDYKDACLFLIELGDYKDAKETIDSDSNLQAIISAHDRKVKSFRTIGNTVTIGTYQQNTTSEEKTAVEWIVLDQQDNMSLLISKYGLDAVAYHQEWKEIEWKDCSLRAWLNNEFLNSTFNSDEINAIVIVREDKVSLLSLKEAYHYLDDVNRPCEPTEYTAAKRVYIRDGKCYWWLIDKGEEKRSAEFISPSGGRGHAWVYDSAYAVRPIIWIDLNSELLW